MAHFHYSNQEPIKQNKKDTEETEMDSIIFATDSFLPNLSWVMGGQAGISSNSSLCEDFTAVSCIVSGRPHTHSLQPSL